MVEVTTNTRGKEQYPIHCGTTVLHLSKLILMKFCLFLEEFLEENSFELCYTGEFYKTFIVNHKSDLDTDSMCVVMTDDMQNLIRSEKRNEWSEAQKRWFVQNENDPRDLRFPGKMKEEWSSTQGGIIWYI